MEENEETENSENALDNMPGSGERLPYVIMLSKPVLIFRKDAMGKLEYDEAGKIKNPLAFEVTVCKGKIKKIVGKNEDTGKNTYEEIEIEEEMRDALLTTKSKALLSSLKDIQDANNGSLVGVKIKTIVTPLQSRPSEFTYVAIQVNE